MNTNGTKTRKAPSPPKIASFTKSAITPSGIRDATTEPMAITNASTPSMSGAAQVKIAWKNNVMMMTNASPPETVPNSH